MRNQTVELRGSFDFDHHDADMIIGRFRGQLNHGALNRRRWAVSLAPPSSRVCLLHDIRKLRHDQAPSAGQSNTCRYSSEVSVPTFFVQRPHVKSANGLAVVP